MRALALAVLLAGCGSEEAEVPGVDAFVPFSSTTLTPPRLPRSPPRRFHDPPPWSGRHDFDLGLGVEAEDGTYIPLADGDEVPIVRGPQALIHLEIAFRAGLPETAAPPRVQVVGTTRVGCAAPVAGYALVKRLPIYAHEGGGLGPATPALFIFDQPNPEPYIGQDCCVTLHVGVWREAEVVPSEWSTAERRLRCMEGAQ